MAIPGLKLQLQLGRIIEDQFATYMRHLYPVEIPEVQRLEVRKAFFSGVLVVLGMLEVIGENYEISEESGGEILESVREECIRFAQGLPPNEPKPFIWVPGSTH